MTETCCVEFNVLNWSLMMFWSVHIDYPNWPQSTPTCNLCSHFRRTQSHINNYYLAYNIIKIHNMYIIDAYYCWLEVDAASLKLFGVSEQFCIINAYVCHVSWMYDLYIKTGKDSYNINLLIFFIFCRSFMYVFSLMWIGCI